MSGLSKDTPISLLEFPGSEASMKLCLFPKNAKRIDYAVVFRFGNSAPSEAMEAALKRCGFKVGNNRLWRFEFPDADSLKAIPELGSALGASVKIMTYAGMVKEGLVLDFRNGPVTSWDGVVKKEGLSGKAKRINWAKTREELLVQILPYAQGFTSLNEWQKGNKASYVKAVKFADEQGKGLTREVGRLLGWDMRDETIEWARTREDLLAQILPYAQDFTSLSEWEKGHGASYAQAVIFQDDQGKGLTREVGRLLGWDMKEEWAKTREELLAEIMPYAQGFTSLSEWQKGHGASYAQAVIFQDDQGKGLTREVGRLLGWDMREQWAKTRDELLIQIMPYAQGFKSLTEWKKEHNASYQQALVFQDDQGKGLTREVGRLLGWDMRDETIEWARTREDLLAQIMPYAQGFTSLSEWQKEHGASYAQAVIFQDDQGKGLTREVGRLLGWDMQNEAIKWAKTREDLLAQILPYAQDFTSLSEWQKGHGASYAQAVKFADDQGKGLTREVGRLLKWDMNEDWAKIRDELLAQILPYALDFASINEWRDGHNASYQQAVIFQDDQGKGLVREVGRLLEWDMNEDWANTRGELIAQILPYAQDFTSLREWEKGHKASYSRAVKFTDEQGKGLTREVGRLLGWDMKEEWAKTREELLAEIMPYAQGFTSLSEWQKGHGASYAQAVIFQDDQGKGLTREVGRLLGWDMQNEAIEWAKTREELFPQILAYAQDFKSLKSWAIGHFASYNRAVIFQDEQGKSLTRGVGRLLGWDMRDKTIEWAKTRDELFPQILPYAQSFKSLTEWGEGHYASYARAAIFQDQQGKGLTRDVANLFGWENEYPKQNILYLWSSYPTDHDSPIAHGITKIGLTSEMSSGESDRRISKVHRSCLPALTRPDVLLLTPIDGKAAENITRQIEMSALKSGIGDIDHGITIKGDISGGRTEMRATSPIETLKLLLRMRKDIHKAGLEGGASPESLHFMEARALADVSDYVRISPLARMSIFKENGAGQKILARMIKTLEADPSGFMNQRDTPMLDGDQLLYRMQRAGRELGISVPMMDDVPLETYKSFIGESMRVVYFEDLKEFDWAGLVRMREDCLVKIETGEIFDPVDYGDAPAGRRRMDESIEERFDLLHDRIVTKTMRGIAKGWLKDEEELIGGGFLDHFWCRLEQDVRESLQDSIRREVNQKIAVARLIISDDLGEAEGNKQECVSSFPDFEF